MSIFLGSHRTLSACRLSSVALSSGGDGCGRRAVRERYAMRLVARRVGLARSGCLHQEAGKAWFAFFRWKRAARAEHGVLSVEHLFRFGERYGNSRCVTSSSCPRRPSWDREPRAARRPPAAVPTPWAPERGAAFESSGRSGGAMRRGATCGPPSTDAKQPEGVSLRLLRNCT